MHTPSNTERLKQLMKVHDLTISDVAELLGRSKQTVKEWRCQNSRNISPNNLELLELKLSLRSASNAS